MKAKEQVLIKEKMEIEQQATLIQNKMQSHKEATTKLVNKFEEQIQVLTE